MTSPVISAWSAVSPLGIGARSFADGLAQGRGGVVELDATWPTPASRAAPVPAFEVRAVLGRSGTRSMDRLSALAVATTGDLLAPDSRQRALMSGATAAFVLGTSLGSVKSMMDITRDTLTQAKPYFIDTGRIPNAIMNSAAAQCAIWHGLRGPNATIAGGRVAVLLALRYALRLLAAGRATAVLCGGAEELTPERIWLEHHCGRSAPLGEGCAVWLIEPPGPDQPALAEILAVEIRACPAAGWSGVYADCLRGALNQAGLRPDEVGTAVPSGSAECRDTERRVLADVLGGSRTTGRPDAETWGDSGAATTAFQIAALLAGGSSGVAGQVAVVMSLDASGVIGCAVLRIGRP